MHDLTLAEKFWIKFCMQSIWTVTCLNNYYNLFHYHHLYLLGGWVLVFFTVLYHPLNLCTIQWYLAQWLWTNNYRVVKGRIWPSAVHYPGAHLIGQRQIRDTSWRTGIHQPEFKVGTYWILVSSAHQWLKLNQFLYHSAFTVSLTELLMDFFIHSPAIIWPSVPLTQWQNTGSVVW
jgi:hypothetical protein